MSEEKNIIISQRFTSILVLTISCSLSFHVTATPLTLYLKFGIESGLYKSLFNTPFSFPTNYHPSIPVMMFSEDKTQVVPEELVLFLVANIVESDCGFDLDLILAFLQENSTLAEHLATLPEIHDLSSDDLSLSGLLQHMVNNEETATKLIRHLFDRDIGHASVIEFLLANRSVFMALLSIKFSSKKQISNLLQMMSNPLFEHILSAFPEHLDKQIPILQWIVDNYVAFAGFLRNIPREIPDTSQQKQFLSDAFSCQTLVSGLLSLGSTQIEGFIRAIEYARPGSLIEEGANPIHWLDDFQQVLQITPVQLGYALEIAGIIIQDHPEGHPRLNRLTFLLTLLRRMRLASTSPFENLTTDDSTFPLTLQSIEQVYLPGFGSVSSILDADEKKSVCLLLLSILLRHWHLVPLLYPLSNMRTVNSNSLLLANLELIQKTTGINTVSFISMLFQHPELFSRIVRHSSDINRLTELTLSADDYNTLLKLLNSFDTLPAPPRTLASRISVVPASHPSQPLPFHSIAGIQLHLSSGPLAPAVVIEQNPANSFQAMMEQINNNEPDLHSVLVTHPDLSQLLSTIYCQGHQLWLNVQILISAAELVQTFYSLQSPIQRAHFLLILYSENRVQNIRPFTCRTINTSQYPQLIQMISTILQRLLALADESQSEALAETVLILLGQDPSALCQIMHPGLAMGAISIDNILNQLERMAQQNKNPREIFNLVHILMVHTSLIMPVSMVAEHYPHQLTEVLHAMMQISPNSLIELPHWQLQVLTFGLYASFQPLGSDGVNEPVPEELIHVLSEVFQSYMPFATPHLEHIAFLLIRRFPALSSMRGVEEIQQFLKKKLSEITIQPGDL